MREFIPKRAR